MDRLNLPTIFVWSYITAPEKHFASSIFMQQRRPFPSMCMSICLFSFYFSLSFATIMLLTKCTFRMNAYHFHRALIFIYFNGYTFILALLIDGAL